MNPLNDNPLRDWSGRLGELAAEQASSVPAGPFTQIGSDAAGPSRLARVLDHFRRQNRRREHAADKLRAAEFIQAP